MATTATRVDGEGKTYIYEWDLTDDETGDSVSIAGAADRSVHIFGTFGGATVTIEGSNESESPTDFVGLNEQDSTAISATSKALFQIEQNVIHIRPVVTGGTSSAIKIRLACRSTMR